MESKAATGFYLPEGITERWNRMNHVAIYTMAEICAIAVPIQMICRALFNTEHRP